MRKRKETQLSISTFEQADAALKEIGLLEIDCDAKEGDMNTEIIQIKEKYEPDITAGRLRIKELEKDLEKFLKSKKSLFEKIRSKKLTFGTIGWQLGKRHLKPLKGETIKTITGKVFELFGEKYVETKLYLKKDELVNSCISGAIDEEELNACGATTEQPDRPYYKVDKAQIKKIEED